MKIQRVIQSVLFAIILVGVFAAMAKNAYGFTLMGIGCFWLALLYMVQLIWKLVEDHFALSKSELLVVAELFLLSILLTLFGLRAFYIYLPGGEFVFIMICSLLLVVYSVTAYNIFTDHKMNNLTFAVKNIFFFSSVIFFILAMLTRTVTLLSLAFGALAVLAALPFLFSIIRQQKFEVSGKSISLFQFVASSSNKAGLLFLFFLSSSLYVGISQAGLIPVIENADRPKAYIELINEAESGKEKPVDGKYHHEKYKKVMDDFLKRHRIKK